jgi:hypothetical protein
MNSNECENELQRPSQFINEGGGVSKFYKKKLNLLKFKR